MSEALPGWSLRLAAVASGLGLFAAADLALGATGWSPIDLEETTFSGYSAELPHFVLRGERWEAVRGEMRDNPGFAREKPQETIRVVYLGGSTVAMSGPMTPTWIVESLLRGVTRDRFEVINGGGNGYGTSRIRLVFDELMAHDPDFVLLYAGHNEFPESRYNAELRLPPTPALQLQLGLRRSAIYRSLALTRRADDGSALAVSALPPGEPMSDVEEDALMARLADNLTHIAAGLADAGVPSIWFLPASNLQSPPRASDPGDGPECASMIAEAEVEPYELALIDALVDDCPNAAIGWFRLGNRRRAAGDVAGAFQALSLARDLDRLPDRATSRTRAVIAEVAGAWSIPTVDVEATLRERDAPGYLDGGFSPDRMHLTGPGYDAMTEVAWGILRDSAMLPGDALPPFEQVTPSPPERGKRGYERQTGSHPTGPPPDAPPPGAPPPPEGYAPGGSPPGLSPPGPGR